jgi:hypothetical protein
MELALFDLPAAANGSNGFRRARLGAGRAARRLVVAAGLDVEFADEFAGGGVSSAVIRQQTPQPGAVVGIHGRSSGMSWPLMAARTVRAAIAAMKTVISATTAMA